MIVVGIVLVVLALIALALVQDPDAKKIARVAGIIGLALIVVGVLLEVLDDDATRDLDTAVRQFLNV